MNKYAKWLQMSTDLKKLKEAEMRYRKELCIEIFEGKIGKMQKIFEFEGYKIVAKNSVSTKLDKEAITTMWDDLTDIEKTAIKWEPFLIAKEYKNVNKNSILQECITVKPSAPTLQVTKL